MSDGDLRGHLLDTLGTLFNSRGSNIKDFNLPRKSVITSSDFTIIYLMKSYLMMKALYWKNLKI
jgi:hypothetical protein